VLEVVFILLEPPSPSRRIFIGSRSLPPSLVRRIGPSIVVVYIDDIIVKSAGDDSHLADLRLAFEKMCRYKLKMNPLKCAFGVSAGKFLGYIVHEKGIEIDPKKD
jgi:hypothetical protein